MIKNVLFDLDGTLSDSSIGVIGCFQHTLGMLAGPHYTEEAIIRHVGTPLRRIFTSLLDTVDAGIIDRAVAIFHEKYAEIGITGNALYPGIRNVLADLHNDRLTLFVVTMKNKNDAGKVIDFLGLNTFFTGVYGPDASGFPERKALLIETVLQEHCLKQAETVMIGDRKEDIIAGKDAGTRTIGITWGFGSRQELEDVKPDGICRAVGELLSVIRRQ